jgi:hypothetical protein
MDFLWPAAKEQSTGMRWPPPPGNLIYFASIAFAGWVCVYYFVPSQKRGILVEIKACEKFYRRYMVDIPRIKF